MSLYTTHRLLVLVLLILLAFKPLEIHGVRKLGTLSGEKEKEDGLSEMKARVLVESNVVNADAIKKSAAPAADAPSYDPDRMSNRRVRRGSDPIHNRC